VTILHSEPQYKLREVVDEFLGRSRLVIHEMGEEFEKLLRGMSEEFDAFRQGNYLILLDNVRFEWIRWSEGGIRIEFSVNAVLPPADPEDRPRHAVIDDWVDGIVGVTMPEGLRAEFAGFVRSLIVHFGLLKKHNNVSLKDFTFSRPGWFGERVLKIEVLHQGRPFVPGVVRID
jgi:hypothetical protein